MHQRFTLLPLLWVRSFSLAFVILVLAGCGDSRSFPKVYEVHGTILVNGQPTDGCQIFLSRTSGPQLETPASPQGITDSNGEFLITSYNTDDGAPEGEYVVTIEWHERTGITKQEFGGPDKLGGAYSKVDKTKGMAGFTLKIEGAPLQLPPFKLTQSADAKAKADGAKKGPLNLRGPLK
jgi:hypothetical protein